MNHFLVGETETKGPKEPGWRNRGCLKGKKMPSRHSSRTGASSKYN
jgi:hypothetical protein